jgi:hypothetical protein
LPTLDRCGNEWCRFRKDALKTWRRQAADKPNEPFGHLEKGKVWKTEDPREPIPPFIQPVGIVSVSVPEYVTFLQFNLLGLNGEPTLLSAPAFAHACVWVWTRMKDYGGWRSSNKFPHWKYGFILRVVTLVQSCDIDIAVLINAGGERPQAVTVAANSCWPSFNAIESRRASLEGGTRVQTDCSRSTAYWSPSRV